MTLSHVEHSALRDLRLCRFPTQRVKPTKNEILRTYLTVALRIGSMIRSARMRLEKIPQERKLDDTPVTAIDQECEEQAREMLSIAFPDFGFVGEEGGGGEVSADAYRTAMDPIDATWSFLSHDSTNGVSLALMQGKVASLGIVLNPATGELAYAQNNAATRLLQLDAFGEGPLARRLPSVRPVDAASKTLINFHNANGDSDYFRACMDAWAHREVRHTKSPGGSPAIGLLEAAKGHYAYVQDWGSNNPATPYDLLAGVKLVENAGGSVVNLEGNPIEPIGHTGLLIATINEYQRDNVLSILRRV